MMLYRSIDDAGVADPDESQVIAAIDRALTIPESAAEEERIVILSEGPLADDEAGALELLQLTADPFGWAVEHGDRRSRTLLRSPRGLPAERVRALFLAFLRGDDSFRKAVEWRDVSHPGPRTRRRSVVGVLVLILAFIAGAAAVAVLTSLAS